MTCNKRSLWDCYHNIVFTATVCPTFRSFAIITAANPFSGLLDDAHNARRNQSFAANLSIKAIPFCEITGKSPDGSWKEPGFAVAVPLDIAITLATEVEQNAIYWVEDNRVYLVPVTLTGYETELIGAFSDLFRQDVG
ncbi:DUF3293 domain-containing protein [Parasalinivibrio latis]|uniref:DUF3293 domain-containing protein n=1 Tax=Parasalinivibrio latis TaxID=2952610 RepID=UPI0030DEBC8C